MKLFYLSFFAAMLLTGCSTRVKITKDAIHKNGKLTEGIWLEKISVDSFAASGMPAKYRIDSVFEATTIANLDYQEIPRFLNGSIKTTYLRFLQRWDSIRIYGKTAYRGEDSINLYGTHYIPAGEKKAAEFYELAAEMDHIKATRMKQHYSRTIHFTKQDKYYSWFTWKYNDSSKKVKLKKVTFQKMSWYSFSMDCSFGLLATGSCTFYFYFTEKEKLILFKDEHIKDGAW